jgi:hypothetical protein
LASLKRDIGRRGENRRIYSRMAAPEQGEVGRGCRCRSGSVRGEREGLTSKPISSSQSKCSYRMFGFQGLKFSPILSYHGERGADISFITSLRLILLIGN